jgi:uncharacterized protein (DUF2147 family)
MSRFFSIIALVFFTATTVFATDKTSYEGHYWNEEKDGIVKLQLTKDGGIEGITIWGETPSLDVNNPNPALRDRSLSGIIFLWGFSYQPKKNRWEDGNVYDPDTGKTYSAKLSLEKGGKILKMRGFIGISLFGRTAKFERVKDEDFPEDFPK